MIKPLLRSILRSAHGEIGCMPLKPNKFIEKGRALVGIEESSKEIGSRVKTAVDSIGGFKKVINKGDSVLLKPNYVFNRPPPCTTAVDFLLAVIKNCYKAGASEVVVGESSAYWVDTEKTMRELGMLEEVQRTGSKVVFFDKERWVKVKLNSNLIGDIAFPKEAFKHDRVVFLPNMKTHHLARFTLSLKLAYGFLSIGYRAAQMHFINLEKKIAEVNKAVHPDLVVMDGRKCFVTGGPSEGDVENPNVILASGDRIAIDSEAVKVLRSYGAKNRLVYEDPFMYDQIRHAARLGLGVRSGNEIKIVKVP